MVSEMMKKICRVLYNTVRFLGHRDYRNLLAVESSVHIDVAKRATLRIGRKFRARRGVEINVRDCAKVTIGNDVFLNSGCILTARERIAIGNNTIFGPNVMVFDNDHRIEDGKVLDNQFQTQAVEIGSNVWIGAGAIILKGSVIEDNCVIAAGSIVKGHVETGMIFMQKRQEIMIPAGDLRGPQE